MRTIYVFTLLPLWIAAQSISPIRPSYFVICRSVCFQKGIPISSVKLWMDDILWTKGKREVYFVSNKCVNNTYRTFTMIKWIISWLLFSVYAGVVDVVLSVKLYFYIGTFARGCQYFIAPRHLFLYEKQSYWVRACIKFKGQRNFSLEDMKWKMLCSMPSVMTIIVPYFVFLFSAHVQFSIEKQFYYMRANKKSIKEFCKQGRETDINFLGHN